MDSEAASWWSRGSTTLVLVRHGESTYNAERRWQGHADPPLSELGRKQAAVAAVRLPKPHNLIASDLRRAAETAELLSQAGHWGLTPETQVTLRERDVGPLTGLLHDEARRKYPNVDRGGPMPDGFELSPAVIGRVWPTLAKLATRFRNELTVVVSHGGVIGAVEEHLGHRQGRVGNLDALMLRWPKDGAVDLCRRIRLLEEID